MNYRILPPDGLLEARIPIPLSKSVSARALIINALTTGAAPLTEVARCRDTEIMQQALAAGSTSTIDTDGAGTAMRFLTALFAAREGAEITLTGNDRMLQRPIGPLVDALRACGADIDYAATEGFPPLRIHGRRLTGGAITIDATVSSQFTSALLMVAPTMTDGLTLTLEGEPASLPYIDLTISMMQRAGIDAEREHTTITIPAGTYRQSTLTAEGDWSAATFWLEIEALTSGFITLTELQSDSRQPDRQATRIFAELGAIAEPSDELPDAIDLMGSPDLCGRLSADLSDTPDMVPAIVVTCAMTGIPFRLTGLASLRIKECDRIEALATEMARIGVIIDIESNDTISWDGRRRPILELPRFQTYSDHRMAMALAPVGAYIPGIVVCDAEVVNKSYPDYWDHLRLAGFTVTDADTDTDDSTTPQTFTEGTPTSYTTDPIL